MPPALVPTFRWAEKHFLSPSLFLLLVRPVLTCILIFSCGVLSRLRRLEPGAVSTQYSPLLDCICSWGQAADIFELITEWLTEALPKQGVSKYNTRDLWMRLGRLIVYYVFDLLVFFPKNKKVNQDKSYFFVNIAFLSTSGQRKHHSKSAYPGDGGSQTRPGSSLPGVSVQPHLNTGESPRARSETAEAAPYGSRKLEGMLDTLLHSF